MKANFNELPRILVVDDKIENQLSTKAALQGLKAEVFLAGSGHDALELMLENDFAVILLDVQMPGMDGYETATYMKSNNKTKHIPIIFLTAINKDEVQMFKGYDSGAIDYLFKPVNPSILKSKVKAFLYLYNMNKNSNLELLKELQEAKAKLEQKNAELEYIARHDSLTMLPNRFTFEEDLKRIIAASKRYKRKFAVLFIDLDNFKWINDNYGHDHGDIVLQEIASIVKKSIREEDYSARIGGDEFAVILANIDRYGNAAIVAEKIINQVTKNPLTVYEKNINVTVSIGIACYPICSETTKMLTKQADIAMYRAKSLGKNNFCFFSEEIKTSFNNINSIREELQNALRNNELYLHYQPIVNMADNSIRGVESLLRWHNSKLGLIPPSEFIFLAEETRLIHEIGLWVIEETCKFMQKCRDYNTNSIFFSINLSPRQLEKETFNEELSNVLKKYNANPAQIDLELTETNLSSFLNSSNRNYLIFLKQTHLRLSIDDFGTGYSSLDRLAALPINTLKIDGSFVNKINNGEKSNTIIKGIVALAKSLNMQTIAECVETKAQADFLLDHNCELGQGFYFYKPMPEEKLLDIMVKEST